ncbi:phospholipase A and acyltransferase 3-like [Actinia tenebrosa]|uniref:Phospholipase A and acyltransferase 3-like n=1 Tax=Actinia tenebrosa TaxID=6105 RepID=A0A6P8HPU3_ACTTE|nr:phospholipase A and acyltransferase 3-like [Actinia tenebrosa]
MSEDFCPGKPGDLVVFIRKKGAYRHYAVNVGDGYIIHATSVSDERVGSFDVLGCCSTSSNIAMIKKEKYSHFKQQGDKVRVEDGSWNDKPPLPVEEIIERAQSKIGVRDYSVLFNNCEHFARWCRYGEESSDQVDGLIRGVAAFGAFGAIAADVIAGKRKTRHASSTSQ